jgi:signal peptide peptidase SppA
MTVLLHIAERVLNRPLLVHPDKLPLILAVLQGRIPISGADLETWREDAEARLSALPPEARAAIAGPAPEASRFVGSSLDENGKPIGPFMMTRDGVANIPVIGSLVNRGAWVGAYSGRTSYEGLQYQIRSAADDPRVKSILLDINSPGGEASGAFETAAVVRHAAARKPVTAVVNGMAASAAYAIASAATKIVTTPTGVSGSIGVVMLHADYSRYLDKAGITPTYIFAGAHKVDGHPFAPLPDEVREDLQREVNAYYDLFVEAVTAGRRALSPAAVRATEARTFIGADAVAAGLADSVGTFDEALTDLSRGSGRIAVSTSKGSNMEKNTGEVAATTATTTTTPAAIASVAALAAAYSDLVAQVRSEAAEGERKRILGIAQAAAGIAGLGDLVAEMQADGTTTPEQAAMRILNAQKEARGKQLQAVKDVEGLASDVKAAPSSTGASAPAAVPAATTREGWAAEYAASEKLQKEFSSVDNYVAYKANESKVRVLRK